MGGSGGGAGKGPRGTKVLGMQKVGVGKRPSDKIPGGGGGGRAKVLSPT